MINSMFLNCNKYSKTPYPLTSTLSINGVNFVCSDRNVKVLKGTEIKPVNGSDTIGTFGTLNGSGVYNAENEIGKAVLNKDLYFTVQTIESSDPYIGKLDLSHLLFVVTNKVDDGYIGTNDDRFIHYFKPDDMNLYRSDGHRIYPSSNQVVNITGCCKPDAVIPIGGGTSPL